MNHFKNTVTCFHNFLETYLHVEKVVYFKNQSCDVLQLKRYLEIRGHALSIKFLRNRSDLRSWVS